MLDEPGRPGIDIIQLNNKAGHFRTAAADIGIEV
jgi:hypothetical protein